jgi:D-3-phosphoglycerate dehydrogenase
MKILFSAPYMIPMLERFQFVFDHYRLTLIVPEQVKERLDEEELLNYAGEFDGAICGDDRFTTRVLEACAPRLKVISKWGTGIDSIDQIVAQQLSIQVYRTPNAFTMAVADTVMGYILAFARQGPWMDRAMKAGNWTKLPSRSLSECTLGVVGVGNIGKAVIRRARVFGMNLLGNDIIDISTDFIKENDMEMTSLEELMPAVDFLSINCDLNPSSYYLINNRTLQWMKPHAVLINTARGPIIDEEALIDALRERKIAGAALDVFEDEPLPIDSPLLGFDNVLLAPHNANSSPSAWERVHWNTIYNLIEGLGLEVTDLNLLRKADKESANKT